MYQPTSPPTNRPTDRPAAGASTGTVAIVRISGSDALALATRVFRRGGRFSLAGRPSRTACTTARPWTGTSKCWMRWGEGGRGEGRAGGPRGGEDKIGEGTGHAARRGEVHTLERRDRERKGVCVCGGGEKRVSALPLI